MSWFWIIWLALSAIIVVIFAYKVSRPRHGPKQRGVKPGQGSSLVEGGAGAVFGGSGGGHSTVTRVSRDPQKYAQAFVPGSAKGKKK